MSRKDFIEKQKRKIYRKVQKAIMDVEIPSRINEIFEYNQYFSEILEKFKAMKLVKFYCVSINPITRNFDIEFLTMHDDENPDYLWYIGGGLPW